jgi:hypothetical protein
LDVSSVDPSGRSRITWNSDLLSKGSIFICTIRAATRPIEASRRRPMPA